MRKLALMAIVCLAFSSPLDALSDAPAMPKWMTGAWQHAEGVDWADEFWTPLRGDMMFGSSRSGTGEKMNFWEQMRIQKEDDGGVVFWAVSGDQKPVRFIATASTENAIMFENAEHDYPQRIQYWREGNVLNAEISLIDGSNAVQFTYSQLD